MADSTRYSNCDEELLQLFDDAVKGNSTALSTLADILQSAVPGNCGEWDIVVRQTWMDCVTDYAKKASVSVEAESFLLALMKAGFDSHELRKLYSALAGMVFKSYENTEGLIEALGLDKETTNTELIAGKWNVLRELKVGAYCKPGGILGLSIIKSLDSNNDTVKFQDCKTADGRTNVNGLGRFIETCIIIKKDSPVTKWIKDKKITTETKLSKNEIEKIIFDSAVTAFPDKMPKNLPLMLFTARAIADAKVLISKKKLEEAPATEKATEKVEKSAESKPATGREWTSIRSLQELFNEFKSGSDYTNTTEEGRANIQKILLNAAPRSDFALQFASCLSYLEEHISEYTEWMTWLITELKPVAIVWQDIQLFNETSDKLPGALILAWFDVTYKACGADYLVERTFQLPFKLWRHTERVLEANKASELLKTKAATRMDEGKASADMLFWLWDSKTLDADFKTKYLTNSTLIFNTLLAEVKGSYLKAQRDIRKLLLTDESFQRTVMKGGDPHFVSMLVRCAKRMTLLDRDERQSLLVQIVRLYPEHRTLVEDKKDLEHSTTFPRLTSYHSLWALQQKLEHLINVEIPQNITAIEEARAHGDLSENSEFKYAKENQKRLGILRSEYEKSLNNVKGTDFKNVNVTNAVIPGCTITIEYASSGETKEYHILGLLDNLPEKGIIAYNTPLATPLLTHKVGETVKIKIDKDTEMEVTIKSVSRLSDEMLAYVSSQPEPIED